MSEQIPQKQFDLWVSEIENIRTKIEDKVKESVSDTQNFKAYKYRIDPIAPNEYALIEVITLRQHNHTRQARSAMAIFIRSTYDTALYDIKSDERILKMAYVTQGILLDEVQTYAVGSATLAYLPSGLIEARITIAEPV